jgi:hypothetical protein
MYFFEQVKLWCADGSKSLGNFLRLQNEVVVKRSKIYQFSMNKFNGKVIEVNEELHQYRYHLTEGTLQPEPDLIIQVGKRIFEQFCFLSHTVWAILQN